MYILFFQPQILMKIGLHTLIDFMGIKRGTKQLFNLRCRSNDWFLYELQQWTEIG